MYLQIIAPVWQKRRGVLQHVESNQTERGQFAAGDGEQAIFHQHCVVAPFL